MEKNAICMLILTIFKLIIRLGTFILTIISLVYLNQLRKISNNDEISLSNIESCINSDYNIKLSNQIYFCQCQNELYNNNCTENQLNQGCNSRIKLNENNEQIRFLSINCDYYLSDFKEKGALKTYNIDMSKLHSYSKALFIIIIITICFIPVFNLIFFIITKEALKSCEINTIKNTILIMSLFNHLARGGLFILNIGYLSLIHKKYKNGKFKELEEFGSCMEIKSSIYNSYYSFVYDFSKKYKKFFIFEVIIISLNLFDSFILNIFESLFKPRED